MYFKPCKVFNIFLTFYTNYFFFLFLSKFLWNSFVYMKTLFRKRNTELAKGSINNMKYPSTTFSQDLSGLKCVMNSALHRVTGNINNSRNTKYKLRKFWCSLMQSAKGLISICLTLIFVIKFWDYCAYLKLCMSMFLTFVTNKRTEIHILLLLVLLREIFPTSDNKDYISSGLVLWFLCLILSKFSTYHACCDIDSKFFYWADGISHFLIF